MNINLQSCFCGFFFFLNNFHNINVINNIANGNNSYCYADNNSLFTYYIFELLYFTSMLPFLVFLFFSSHINEIISSYSLSDVIYIVSYF